MPLAVHVLRRRSTRRLGRKEAQWRAGQGTAISFLFCIKAFSGGPSACTLSTCVYTKCSAGMGSRQTDRATVSSELGALGIRPEPNSHSVTGQLSVWIKSNTCEFKLESLGPLSDRASHFLSLSLNCKMGRTK